MKSMTLFNKSLLSIALTLTCLQAQANFTYEGSLVDPTGNPVMGSVALKLEIMSAGAESCLLFSETHGLNMTNPDGYFSVKVGAGTPGANLYPLNKIFQNQVNFTSLVCAVGTTFQGGAGDGRRMRVTVTIGGVPEVLGILDINSVPMADTARSVGAFEASHLLRTVDGSGNPVNAPALGSTQLSDLMNLIAGTSTKYLTQNPTAGSSIPSYSGSPATPMAGSIWYDTTSNMMKYYNGSTSVDLNAAAPPLDLQTLPTDGIKVGSTQFVLLSNNVGIGTAVPGRKLDVVSSAADVAGFKSSGSMSSILIGNSADTPVRLGSDANNFLIMTGTGGTPSERLRITSNGFVGIGTTTPSSTLSVNGSVDVNGPINAAGITSAGLIQSSGGFMATGGNIKTTNGYILAGNDVTSCTSGKYGALRVNAGILEYCDISNTWKGFGGGGSEDMGSGATADFYMSDSVVFTSPPSGSAITLFSINPGQTKTVIIDMSAGSPTTYTFTGSGCSSSVYSPANTTVPSSSKVIYNIHRSSISARCYIDWKVYQ